jgi:hypothetical protein
MKNNFLPLVLCLVASIGFSQDISEKNIRKHITYLASDKLEGRGTGTRGAELAANYIADNFKKYGLEPYGHLCGKEEKDRKNTYFFSYTFKYSPDKNDTDASKKVERSGTNVVGYLDNGAENTIVIGAHYDHLGLGHDHNSRDANPEGKIHNGADDNASGSAGVMELARYFSTNKVKEKYNFLFVCFSGEELGLFGSKKYCENPTIDLSKVDCMINMDMIGRLGDSTNKLVIYGVGTAPDFVPIIDGIKTDMTIKKDSAGIGPSDQTSFYLKNIPVLHFFTGQHSDYHKPSDDADKINYPGEVKVLNYVISVIAEIEKRPKLTYLTTRNPESTKSNYKVTMGVMPDYTYEGKGMKVDGVTEGKPAFRAGIQKGDVVTQMGDVKINSMTDYMKALGQHKKGDTVPVTVIREGKEVKLDVTF